MVHRGTTNAHAALHQDVTGFRTGTPLQHCWPGRCRRAAASSGFCRDLGSTYYNILNQPTGDLGDILVYCDVMTMMLLEVSRLRCCIEGVQHVQLFPHFLHSLRSMRDSMEEATPRTCSLLVLIPSHGAAWGPIVAQANPQGMEYQYASYGWKSTLNKLQYTPNWIICFEIWVSIASAVTNTFEIWEHIVSGFEMF